MSRRICINTKGLLAGLYILSFSVVVVKSGESDLPWFVPYIHCIFWIIVGNIWRRKNKDSDVRWISKHLLLIFIGIQGIFWVFSIFGYINNSEYMATNVVTRAISTSCQSILIFMAVYSLAGIFKEKIFKYSLAGLFVKQIIVIIVSASNYGVSRFFSIVLLPFKYDEDWSVTRILTSIEMHDLTFALGFAIIFLFEYLHTVELSRNEKKSSIWLLCITLFFIYVGYKRIQLLALLAIVGASFFIRGRTKRTVLHWALIITIIVTLLMYGYVWVIDSGILNNFLMVMNLNSRGRIEAYNAMSTFFDFSPLYLGRGKESGVRLKESFYGNTIILGHSDTLYVFLDYGFWGFGCWILYCFYFVTKRINKLFGNKAARVWLLCTIYAFITYATDNTLSYFAFQTMYMTVMFSYIYIENKNKSNSNIAEKETVSIYG